MSKSETKDGRGPAEVATGISHSVTEAEDSQGNKATGHGSTPEQSQKDASDKLSQEREK